MTLQSTQTTLDTAPETVAQRISAGVLIAVTVATLLAELIGATGTWRLVLTTAFVVVVPGWAVVSYARSASASFRWSVGIAVSIAIGIVFAQGMVLLHLWHPELAVAILGALSLPPLAHHLLRTPQDRTVTATTAGEVAT